METRIRQLINSSWKFSYGDCKEYLNAPDSCEGREWYDVSIPHSFGIPYFMENYFYVGYGCYRKVLIIRKEWLKKKICIEFQGVFQEMELYVNGSYAGGHKGGYTGFFLDITDFIQEGENQIFVRVNNEWNPRLAPRAGEHVFQGGIYRDVSLLITEPVHVAWYGTFVRTPWVTKDSAMIAISTEIENAFEKEINVELVSHILFQETPVLTMQSAAILAAGESRTLEQGQMLEKPRLWHPDTPNLYLLKTELYMEGRLVDTYDTEFGIRWFSFSATQGFFLNGEHYDILGANVHQDHAGWGDAVTHTGIQRDVKLIKDCGMNFIRGSHYPHHPYFAQECDRQGILFWSELCYWGCGDNAGDGYWNSSAYPVKQEDEAEFEESCRIMLKDMIRVNRNHPSIIVWSMGNEVFFSHEKVLDKARRLTHQLVTLTHEYDPTRPAAVGGAQRGDFDILGDLAGYNGDGASLYPNPGFPNFVSEYGSVIADRPGEYLPGFTDHVEEPHPWRSGISLWCAFHHGSIFDKMGHMGIIDYYRLPLKGWYWYREKLLGIRPPQPVKKGTPYAVRLSADREYVKADGTEDFQILLEIIDENGERISNDVLVTLEIMDGAALFPTGYSMRFSAENKNLMEGLGAIEVRPIYPGDIRIAASAEGLVGDELVLRALEGTTDIDNEITFVKKQIYFQPGPPSVFIPSKPQQLEDMAQNRPVFASSYSRDYLPSYINDGNDKTCWRAAGQQPGEWIMQDLEGIKSVQRIELMLRGKTEFEVAISQDGVSFDTIQRGCIADESEIFVELQNQQLRYIKIQFPQKPVAVCRLAVF